MAHYVNNLFEYYSLEDKLISFLPGSDDIKDEYNFCLNLFAKNINISSFNKNTTQNNIIIPIITHLGWSYCLEETKIVSGVAQKFDAVLFSNQERYENYVKIEVNKRRSVFAGIDLILESKAPGVTLDNLKAANDANPYFQLLDYLRKSKLTKGFLTNGRQWYLIENLVFARDKKYLAFSLDKILAERDQESFELFWRLFHAANYNKTERHSLPNIDSLAIRAKKIRDKIALNLSERLFGLKGRPSLFEKIGRALFLATGRPTGADHLKLIFENSQFFLFRLMFAAYFEDRFRDILESHKEYNLFSLKQIIAKISPDPAENQGWASLKLLFKLFERGEPEARISPFGGGLFNPANAPLLSLDSVFNDEELSDIFDNLFKFWPKGEARGRDFAAFSPAILGNIFEGIWEFEFRVADENLFEAIIEVGGDKIEGYFEESALKRPNATQIKITRQLTKGELYLVNSRNNRKVSGSYYTSDSLAYPLVTRGVELQLAGPFQERSILEMRVLDCACGSGQLLIAALNCLAIKAQDRLDSDAALKDALAKEMEAINDHYHQLGLEPNQATPDEFVVLKRLLLKKLIYGVDLSILAVELTKIYLWIDTFIYGIPLPFIDNHIKCGNSLIGSDYNDLINNNSNYLIDDNLIIHIKNIIKELIALASIRDATSQKITECKDKYYNYIIYLTKNINYYINFLTYLDFLTIKNSAPRPPIFAKLSANFNKERFKPLSSEDLSEGERECETYRERLKFFNWKIEFPEVFPEIDRPDDPANGFHLILGNPPWDKTKFEEPLFFAQHHSNYRTLPNSQKRKIAHDLLARPAIKQRYEREKETIELANAYLQAKFPLSRGAGDNNLFRFFVERALGLLAPRGGLSYLAPTGLLTEAGSFKLRKNILENFRLKSFDGFENRNRLFPAVDSRYKFGLIQLEKVRDPDQVAQTRFRLTDPADLATNEGCFPYSLAEIKATSPKHLAYLETSGGELGLKILLKLYKKFPPLEPTWLDFRNELHATKDKKLFHESNNPGFIPLYKGEMIGQYQAFKAPPKYWLDPAEFDNYLLSSRLKTLKNDLKAQYAWDEGFAKAFPEGFQWPRILAFLEASSDQDLARFLVPERSLWRLAFRAIARDTDERTLIAALVPQNRGAQNSLWISIPGRYALDLSQRKIVYQRVSLARLLFAQALFNSLVVDWILRASMAMNVNKTYFQRLPLPQPDDERLLADPTYLDLVKDSAFLSLCQGRELWADLKRAIAFDDSEIPPSPLIFDRRQAGLDFKIATLYGLTPEELEIILDGFKVLRAKRSNYCSLIIDLINNKSLP